jgi:uroporphyrinogen-III synthase
MARPERPLAGRIVWVTRPARQAEALATRLRELGASVETRPTIALEPPIDAAPARRAVSELEHYDWILFTSANGVRFFRMLLEEIHGEHPPMRAAIAAIGPATARELERSGYRPAVVAEDARAEGMAETLAGRIAPGERVLVVRPAVARPVLLDALRASGVRPEPVVFYRNVPAPDVHTLAARVCEDRFDVVILTSPSTLQHLFEAGERPVDELRAALGRARLVAIGPVTAQAIEEHGLTPASVAAQPTADALAQAVRALFD